MTTAEPNSSPVAFFSYTHGSPFSSFVLRVVVQRLTNGIRDVVQISLPEPILVFLFKDIGTRSRVNPRIRQTRGECWHIRCDLVDLESESCEVIIESFQNQMALTLDKLESKLSGNENKNSLHSKMLLSVLKSDIACLHTHVKDIDVQVRDMVTRAGYQDWFPLFMTASTEPCQSASEVYP